MPAAHLQPAELQIRFASGMHEVAAAEWDALFNDDFPFIQHGFLDALERHGCVRRREGWEPCHLLIRDAGGHLVAAAPLYLKAHSYGEFVFDFSWANASHQLGQPYYPKLLNAIPFVPSPGPRLGARDAVAREAALQAIRQRSLDLGLSSAHVLFVDDTDVGPLRHRGWLERQDLQYHWHNRGYGDFSDFVAALTSAKRKKLLRERRRVAEAGIRFEVLPGDQISEATMHQVHALYANTYEERGRPPYLSLPFFLDYMRRADTPVHVIMGYEGARLVAIALTWVARKTLYGRHWGAAEHYHSLHFECCYYQGIELAVQRGLQRYDAGTQGEHKLARGFEPCVTRSFHHLNEPRLRAAVSDFLERERSWVATTQRELAQHAPYRSNPPSAAGQCSVSR